jgi:hypothetical protein
MWRVRLLFLFMLLPALLASCSRVDRLPTAPTTNDAVSMRAGRSPSDLQAHGLTSFYPMAVGNRWRYASVQ